MESEDDTFVVIIGDDGNWKSGDVENLKPMEIKQEIEDVPELDAALTVENILEVASKVGEYIELNPTEETQFKTEPEYLDTEYLKGEIEDEPDREYMNFEVNDDEYIPDEDLVVSELDGNASDFHTDSDSGSKRRKAVFRKSFVEDLRKEYPELRANDTQLVKTLVAIMKSVKRPPPPRDYFVMNDILYECVKCGAVSESEPASWRHWQEKHGKRYLVCYACGVDFRSCTNLYKHEKRCSAKDANIVLKARAIFLGRKGRSRPYLGLAKKYLPKKSSSYTKRSFPCTICSAVFNSKNNLQSHENLHRGLRPYRCHQCPCAYTSVSALARHLQKHKNETFICDHCQRPFKTKPTLIAHMDTHSLVRRFGCNLCEKRYAQKAALKLHIGREHFNLPPPCACQICPKRYPRMSLLKQHMKSAHGMTLMTRKMFFKTLPTLTDTQLQQAILVLKSDALLDVKPEPLEPGELARTRDLHELARTRALHDLARTRDLRDLARTGDPRDAHDSINETDIFEFLDSSADVDMFPDLQRLIAGGYRTK